MALVEVEKDGDYYVAEQYAIKHGWKLDISRNETKNKWIVNRIKDDGTFELLSGKRKIFYVSNEKNPKC